MYFQLCPLILISHLVAEKIFHDPRVKRIPIRIHVNGTRGKSSVVRLIAEVLRKAGITTLAKVTGTEPALVFPDGHEERIERRGPSRIQEQVWLIKRAARLSVEAIVVECMAIEPRTLNLPPRLNMLKSTIGVITNVRPDHFEVMGETLDLIQPIRSVKSIGLPRALVTGDARYFPLFEKSVKSGYKAHLVEPDRTNTQTPGESSLTIHGELLSIVKKYVPDRGNVSLHPGDVDQRDSGERRRQRDQDEGRWQSHPFC